MNIGIHPVVDGGIRKGVEGFSGGTLRCLCSQNPVEVKVGAQVMFNHACGCTKCWKPGGALFSVVGVVPREKVAVTAHGEKLKVVDPKALIQRHACAVCGAHLFGRIERLDHAFHGLDFIHAELSSDDGWEGPGFAVDWWHEESSGSGCGWGGDWGGGDGLWCGARAAGIPRSHGTANSCPEIPLQHLACAPMPAGCCNRRTM